MSNIWKNLEIENLEGEVWKDIEGYENLYQISNFGRVKSLKRRTKTRVLHKDTILKQRDSGKGYLQVKLCKAPVYFYPIVSRLVAEAFLEKPDYECVANHIDCDRSNNSYLNLEWITQSQNIRYAYKLGRMSQLGENNNQAKVTEDIVKEIRKFYSENQHLSQQQIADQFSLKREHVKDIINYKTWKHI